MSSHEEHINFDYTEADGSQPSLNERNPDFQGFGDADYGDDGDYGYGDYGDYGEDTARRTDSPREVQVLYSQNSLSPTSPRQSRNGLAAGCSASHPQGLNLEFEDAGDEIESAREDTATSVLTGYAFQNKEAKIALLRAAAEDPHFAEYFVTKARAFLQQILPAAAQLAKLKADELATAIVGVGALLRDFSTRKTRSQAAANLFDAFVAAEQKAKSFNDERKKANARKVDKAQQKADKENAGVPAAGKSKFLQTGRVYDPLLVPDFPGSSLKLCAHCAHPFINMEMLPAALEAENDRRQQDAQTRKANAAAGKKVVCTLKKEVYMCFCYQMNSHGQQDGGNCLACTALAGAGLEVSAVCEVCVCVCRESYRLSEIAEITRMQILNGEEHQQNAKRSREALHEAVGLKGPALDDMQAEYYKSINMDAFHHSFDHAPCIQAFVLSRKSNSSADPDAQRKKAREGTGRPSSNFADGTHVRGSDAPSNSRGQRAYHGNLPVGVRGVLGSNSSRSYEAATTYCPPCNPPPYNPAFDSSSRSSSGGGGFSSFSSCGGGGFSSSSNSGGGGFSSSQRVLTAAARTLKSFGVGTEEHTTAKAAVKKVLNASEEFKAQLTTLLEQGISSQEALEFII
ncbi:hypothetical protein B484DRAFT_391061 [Ochromonadaceae sp. CCMP2298]|nr:hypothetical protein B484DRAFT_391061 [Ochromonadaceae sp. CCMP2298]